MAADAGGVLGPAAARDLGQHDARLAPPTLGFLNMFILVYPLYESTYMFSPVKENFPQKGRKIHFQPILGTRLA